MIFRIVLGFFTQKKVIKEASENLKKDYKKEGGFIFMKQARSGNQVILFMGKKKICQFTETGAV